MAPHVRESFAHDLIDHLALLRRQHVFGPVARDLDPNRVEAGELIGLRAQVAHQALWSDRSRAQLGERFAHLLSIRSRIPNTLPSSSSEPPALPNLGWASIYVLNKEMAAARSVAIPSCSSRAMRDRSRPTASSAACLAAVRAVIAGDSSALPAPSLTSFTSFASLTSRPPVGAGTNPAGRGRAGDEASAGSAGKAARAASSRRWRA